MFELERDTAADSKQNIAALPDTQTNETLH